MRLIGAARGPRASVGVRHGQHSVRGEQVLADTRTRLDERTFAAAWDAGRARSPEQAVAEARVLIAEVLADADAPPP